MVRILLRQSMYNQGATNRCTNMLECLPCDRAFHDLTGFIICFWINFFQWQKHHVERPWQKNNIRFPESGVVSTNSHCTEAAEKPWRKVPNPQCQIVRISDETIGSSALKFMALFQGFSILGGPNLTLTCWSRIASTSFHKESQQVVTVTFGTFFKPILSISYMPLAPLWACKIFDSTPTVRRALLISVTGFGNKGWLKSFDVT